MVILGYGRRQHLRAKGDRHERTYRALDPERLHDTPPTMWLEPRGYREEIIRTAYHPAAASAG